MKPSGDDVVGLVASFLRRNGFHKAFEALLEESGVREVADTRPHLGEIVDEWSELRAIVRGPEAGGVGETLQVDLGEELSGEAREHVAGHVTGQVAAASAALCCAFDDDGGVVWGEANRTVHFMAADGGSRHDVVLPDATMGGILSAAVCGAAVAVGTMSGAVVMLDRFSRAVKQTLAPKQAKYAHRVIVNDRFVASASLDHTVRVWALSDGRMVREFRFGATCEGLAFWGRDKLVLGVRESNLLSVADLADTEAEPVTHNLNAFGDDHVTFSVLDVAVCAKCPSLVALASDRDRVFLYWLTDASCRLLATLTGMNSDGLAAARVKFSPSGRLLYASSADGNVCVYDTVSLMLLERLKRHKSGVRDLAVSFADEHFLASVSLDKSVVISSTNV
jgi:hypothetical protein